MERVKARSLVRAVAWRTYLTEIGADSTEDFEQWLALDERHREAWRKIQAPWDQLTERANAPELLARRRAALGDAQAEHYRHTYRAARRERRRRFAWAAGVALSCAGAVAAWMAGRPDVYRTAVGERHAVTLEDGSRIVLDAASEVRVSYSDTTRELRLARGQARFDVAADVERPFTVRAAGRKIVAMGTAFNVDLLENRLAVTLLEGRVMVVDQATRQRVELQPGQQWLVADGAPPSVSTVRIDAAMAWQDGQLVVADEPLALVVERMGRYSTRQVEVADPRAQAVLVSGVFNTDDIERFARTMTEYAPVVVEPGRGGTIRLRHR